MRTMLSLCVSIAFGVLGTKEGGPRETMEFIDHHPKQENTGLSVQGKNALRLAKRPKPGPNRACPLVWLIN
jgi:hypothetical protein